MSWWRAKYTNDHDEYEITFGTKYRERAKAVEKVCQMVIDKRIKSPDDVASVVRCRDCIGKSTWYNDAEYGFVICGMSGMYPKSENDYCSFGEMKTDA